MVTNPVALPDQQTKLTSSLIPVSLLLVAVLTLSFAAIFIRWSEQYIGPSATVFNRFWISFVILGLVQGIRSFISLFFRDSPTQQQTYTLEDVLLLLASAAVTSISQISWAWSVTQTSVANSNLLHNLAPIFTTLGGWLLLGHRFNSKFLIGMALAMGGAFTISIQDLHIAGDHLVGDVLALLSAVFYAGNFLVSEKLRVKFSTATILLWSCFFRSCITLPVALFTENQIFPSSLQGWLAVISLAVVCQVIGSGILIYSVKRFSSGFTSMFLLLEPIITAILAWLVFDESLSPLNLLTFFVVLVGIYLAKSGQGADKVETKIFGVDMATE
ncbi:MAG TPA: EamA family transporter [Microcoleaceae bacterium UBA10368]|jgi:Permeases of the drug/metabolite transporter (DMT) superfamily|nr:EamA family transporter [Microcoleaceae cyanobacterium UBA10368]HCV31196.1 EamA family transporter [Microcoleaceae cyanobacterium UBA9251]